MLAMSGLRAFSATMDRGPGVSCGAHGVFVGDVSLLETVLQEFTAFEHLPVTVAEADLLRDIQIHLPVNESDFLQSRRADSRSTQASTASVF